MGSFSAKVYSTCRTEVQGYDQAGVPPQQWHQDNGVDVALAGFFLPQESNQFWWLTTRQSSVCTTVMWQSLWLWIMAQIQWQCHLQALTQTYILDASFDDIGPAAGCLHSSRKFSSVHGYQTDRISARLLFLIGVVLQEHKMECKGIHHQNIQDIIVHLHSTLPFDWGWIRMAVMWQIPWDNFSNGKSYMNINNER